MARPRLLYLETPVSRALGVDRTRALISAAVVGGHKIFFSTSSQHIPDMPLVLGVVLALVGFVHILSREKPPVWVYYAAWLGVAFAVSAKGMLVLLLVALYLPFRLFGARSVRVNLHELGAIIGAVVLAGSWFAYIALSYPEAFMAQFVGDQVAGKAGFDPAQVLAGVLKTSSDLVLAGLPMIVGIALAFLFGRGSAYARIGISRAAVFLIAWCLVTVVVFAFSTQLYERYILPALPALGALLALLSMKLSEEALARGLRWAMWIFLPLPLSVALVSIAFLVKFGSFALALAVLSGAGLVIGGLYALGRRSGVLGGLLGTSMVLPLIAIAILPLHFVFLFPTAGQQIAQLGWGDTDKIILLDNPKLADDIGLQIGGINRFHYQRSFDALRDGSAPHVVFLDAKHLPALEAAGYRIERRYFLRSLAVDWADISEAWRIGDPRAFMARKGELLYIADSR